MITLKKIAGQSKGKLRGARGLRTSIEKIMLGIMYEVPDNKNITECIINEEVIDCKTEPILKTA